VHLIGLDAPAEPVIVLAWAPDDDGRVGGRGDGDGDGETERRGLTVGVVAAFGADLDRAARLVALLAVQLDADDLRDQWPVDAQHVGEMLATDAGRRQGADQPPPTSSGAP
jgi:hypothetical protein